MKVFLLLSMFLASLATAVSGQLCNHPAAADGGFCGLIDCVCDDGDFIQDIVNRARSASSSGTQDGILVSGLSNLLDYAKQSRCLVSNESVISLTREASSPHAHNRILLTATGAPQVLPSNWGSVLGEAVQGDDRLRRRISSLSSNRDSCRFFR